LIGALYQVEEVLLYSSLLMIVKNHEWVGLRQMLSLASVIIIIYFLLWPINMMLINFSNVELALHTWNKSRLVTVYNYFDTSLKSIW
jgi:hypothetical protein